MNHLQSSKILLAALACAAGAVTSVDASAAPSAPAGTAGLNVAVGGVITPGSCTPAAKSVAFDLKKINPASLKEKAETPLAPIVQPLSIKCDGGDAAVALSVTGALKAAKAYDESLDHKATGIRAASKKGYIYDLVDAATATNRIGRYVFQFRNFRYTTAAATDGKAVKALVASSEDRAAWSTAADTDENAAQLKSDGSNYVTFVDAATPTVPVRASLFDGDIVIGAVVSPKSELTLNDNLTFRGEATITLSYL
ncbi:MAG: hypothetical protein ACWGIK_01205 [Achromobacter pulmonis]|uniref:DUF1120 domain-containing protein n=1 Tax=Achromobacter pulmonis TaxID=1389932 RepID=A0A6S7E1J2_9BURK|nr:hypothetical protein [Achromobacter pulmonis]CAB3892246.1 hypothetical protein LMG26788_03838 [Achromobacter pulmonis]